MKILSKVLTIIAAVCFLAAGVLMIAQPARAWVALTWVFALLVLVSGILNIIAYFAELKGVPGAGTILASGIISVILGILLFSNLFMTAFVMTTLFALWLIVAAVQWIAYAMAAKKEEIPLWWLFLILGIVIVVIGLAALLNPVVSAGVITFIFGIGFIIHAVTLGITAFTVPTID